mgnify:CR=1 FL=1
MLRIEIHDAANTLIMRPEGRFVAEFAEEARAVMTRSKAPLKVLVDLSEVTFVDSVGEEVLSWLSRIGGEFVAGTSYSLDVCERLHLPLARKRAESSSLRHS